jgi:hypothetical protein
MSEPLVQASSREGNAVCTARRSASVIFGITLKAGRGYQRDFGTYVVEFQKRAL